MAVYLDGVILLNFVVDFLLLLGTNRLVGFPPGPGKAAVAAGLGGVYAGGCLLPGFRFLGGSLWRLVSLGLMGGLAFGWNKGALRRTVLFVLLAMALGGVALGLGRGGFAGLAAAAAVVCLLCGLGFRNGAAGETLVPVELAYGEKKMRLLALRDTGNTLRDPITGQQVLVAEAEVARRLVGLTEAQLRSPVETVAAGRIPGLRLIPYRAVGKEQGLLLGLRLPGAKIGPWKGAAIVAFAPEKIGGDGSYQALTGGAA